MSENKLNTIPQEGTWGTAATLLNHNFVAIEQEITSLLNSTIKEKGYFTSLESLKVAYPIVPEGSVAYIGTSSPFKLYRYYMGTWQDTGLTGGPDGVNVTDFYNKNEINTLTLGEYNGKVYVYLNGVRLGNGISISGGGSGGNDSEEEEIPDEVTVLGATLLVEGTAADYSATVTPIQKAVTWSISGGKGNDTINANGRLITDGMYGADRTITVKATTASGYYGTKTVTVKKKVFPTSVDISQTGSGALGATYKAVLNEGVNQAYTTKWSISGSDKVTLQQSSNQDVCSVTFSTEATVTFTLTVTITGNFTTLTYSETFTRDGESTGITITPESAQVVEGDTLDFDATVYPDNETVVWSIPMGTGCSIDENTGLLTTLEGYGTRTITIKATTVSGLASAERNVVVLQAVRPTQITVNGSTAISSGTAYTLTVTPSDVNKDYAVQWSIAGSAVNNGYVSLGSQSNTQCYVNVVSTRPTTSTFQLTATLTSGSVQLTKSITVDVSSTQSSTLVNATVLEIDQTVSEPTGMVRVLSDKTQLELIRNNSHRYLGKYVKNDKMHLCQLHDSAPNVYNDTGTAAVTTGASGDVFMKLPRFYYKAIQTQSDVWHIMFNYDGVGIDATWTEWDGKELIGAYKGYSDGSRLRSISGVMPKNNLSQTAFRNLAKARDEHFSLVKWKHHCIMAFLFYAWYETTNSQEKLGAGINAYSVQTGTATASAMGDTNAATKPEDKPISFWGLEAWWGGRYELLDNVVVNRTTANGIWTITEDDESVREVASYTSGSYISKMVIGQHLDLIPTATGATATTGYCDAYQYSTNINSPIRRSGQAYYEEAGIAACGNRGTLADASSYHESRLAYRGDFAIESSSTFNNITNWV